MSDPYAGLPVAPKLFTNQTKVLFSDGAPAALEDLEPIDRPAFRPKQYVVLGDGSRAHWDGEQWVDVSRGGRRSASFDPDASIPKIKKFVEANPDQRDAVLTAERDGKNRSTLIDWLEARTEDDTETP